MACNLGLFNCGSPTLGRTETAPGFLFVRLISPTDFDWSWKNMAARIKNTVSFWRGLDYLGLFGGQLKQFLTAYIETAGRLEKSYVPSDKQYWLDLLEADFPGRFERDNLEVYFDTLYTLQKEGQVTQSIYRPYKYVPEKTTPESIAEAAGKGLGINADKLLFYSVLAAGVLAFAGGGYASLPKLLKKR